MSVLQEEYKLAIDNKMLSPKVSEQDFEKMLKDDTKRKEYWDYCNKKNPSFYAEDYNRFSQLTNEMLGEANKPSVEENPAPTTAQDDSINLAKQNEGEQQYNIVTPMLEQTIQPTNNTAAEPIQDEEKKEGQSALDRGMQIIDDAWDKSGFLGKAFLSPMKLAEVGISLVQGAASGVVEWGGRGAMSLMAQAVENNKAGDYDTFKVDAMGNPMFVPKIGEDGQYEKAGYSIEEQIEAAKRVEQAEAEGKEADIKDKNASMYVRAANKLEKVADRLHKSSMPNDVAEDATFIDLIREGEVMDAVQLSVASTGQSIPYMLLNSLPGGGFIAGTLGQANTYLDLSKEHPEMDKWKRYTYAIGSSGIEQAVEKFTNPFKGLKGASKKEVAKTLKEITDGAEKAIWKRVAGNVLKEAAGEGGEELATSVFTDIFGTMIDTDGEYGIGIIGQYNEYADQMQEQNPTMTNNDILKSFVGNKAKEYAESFIMGALSGAYISTVSSIATRDYAKEEQKKDKIMLDAITTTADANGLVKEDVLGIVMKEQDGELTDEEKNIIKSFNTNYAKATMKSVAEEQGNELVEKIANKSNGYVFEVDFADGSLGEADMAYIVDGAVYTTDADGKTIIDRTTSDKVVYVKVLKEDGSEEVKQVAVDELNLVGTPMQSSEFALQYQQGIYNTAEQLLDAQEQVVGEDNGQQPLGVTEGEQGRNIEGRQFTNGQQTITASNPDSNGNVTLSAPVTLSNGVVTDQVMPQQVFDDLMNGLISEEGWQEVSSQPTNQGQAQGQQQAPQPISWSEMDANQATATVVERSKGDKERAKKFAQKQVEVKTKALQEAQAEMDAFEGDDLDAFNAAQDKVDAAQAEVDKWTAVANGIDTYNAPVQEAPQPTPSATSASGNGVVTEGTAQAPEVQEPASQDPQQPTQEVREEQRRQKKANSLSDIFDNGGTQVDRPTKVKSYKYNPFDFATNDPVRPVMGTAYHEDGHVVSTDAHILVAVKQKYDKKLEGKMTDKDGKVVLESSKFPNWKLVFDGAKTHKADMTAISVDDFRSFLEGAKAKLKAEWQAKKDNGEKVGSFKDYLYNKADVMVRTNGGTHAYRLGRLIDFANALSEIGAKEVFFDGRRDTSAQPMAAETNQGKAMIMPVLVDNISIEEDGRVVVGNSNTAFLYDLADKKTRMAANNSQNTLQNEKLSVTLQTEKSAAQKVIDKIDGGQYKTLVFNDENIEQQMRDAGFSEDSINSVKRVIARYGAGAIDGFYENGVVFVYENQSEDKVRSKYVHERQHGLNDEKGNRKQDVVNASTESHLKRVVRRMAGNDFYDQYDHVDVADEFICRAMEIAYSVDTDAELEAELRKYGANEQLIQIIKDLNNEQRKDTNLGKARKSSYVAESSNESSREGERDSEEISSRVLGQEGSGPNRVSGSRDRSGRPSEVGQDTALEESGIQVNDETGDARFSVNYRLDANQMDILAEQIAERVGVSKAKAKKWLKAETSLAALCMQEDNVDALYYFADGRYGAIKNNSDYPQGTVDFNNICRKRLDFTNIYLSMQREFPNKVFTAKDLETIRQIMIEDGLEVACGLCYVEDRRQLLGEIANEFRGFLKDRVIPEDLSATKKEVMQKVLDMVGDDTYIPTIAQLLEAGAYELRNSHPSIFEAFVVFNNSRGMQSGRLFEGYAEYKREILDWSDKKVKQVNDAGGLRIFSFSDFEAHHLIDIVQIISDAASKGVMIQGYTKVPEFARAIRNTKVKLNRSLIALGDTGIQEVNGEKVLAYDTSEGIDVNSENFLDESNNPNVGNVLVGINDEQIRMAMDDTNVDYIIPFHTGLKKDILLQKKIGAWVNYKNSQTEKDATTGSSKTADGKKVVGVNIYTDVLQAAEKEGTPIKNRKEFVEYFLKVCKERGLVPRFEQFLARGKNGEYKYTKGYEKLLVDFKMFDKRGNILPQEPVVPIFDDAFNQQIIEDYVKGTKETKEYESTKEKIKENLQLNESTDDLATSENQVRFSVVTDKELLNELEGGETIKVYRAMQLQDGKLYPPMSGKVDGEWRNPIELGVWEQADETPDKAIARKGKDGKVKYVFKLDKGNKKSLYAAYNPYIHTSRTPLNDQFSEAQDRPELVTVEVEIPTSELTSGYKAEKAKDAVGELEWKAGVVQGQLTGTRKVILSRYDKPIRIVPDAEVAERIVEMIDGNDVVFPSNVVTPQLREELEGRGIQFKETDNQGKPRFSISNIAEDAWNKYQYDGELESIRDVANYIEENMPKNEQTQALFDAIDAYNIEELEDRELYGMRGDLEPFEDAILNELETLMNSKPRFSVTAEEDKAYADAVARGDIETAQRMVIEAAKKAMPNTKIVDADGNPMIVYHDTNATELVNIETGENWNDLDWRAKDEWRNREDFDEYWEERDFYTFNNLRSRRSIEMPAYFFSTKEDEYHEYGNRTIRAFLNITNPAMDPTIENAGTYDYAGEDAMNKLIEQGYDGFIRTMDNGEWDEVNAFYPNQIKSAEPATYDDNGELIPLSKRFDMENADIRFSISNNNQRIFISNAEKAVESIKQEKATPQQWKAMIEKQGGLKAGEDKWLGLSEWLDSKVAPAQENDTMGEAARRVAKNTITKQEILDYIAEHQIQIEDVQYMDADDVADIDLTPEQQEKYDQFVDEYKTIQEEDGLSEEEAFEELVERYGEDFTMAFFVDSEGELQIQGDYDGRTADAALYYLGGEQVNVINRTRLGYTTKGLKNNREIALTVPTIESWNEGDEIHFGDAGDGRAIAWIRFGETKVQTPREVVDHVDELQFAFTNVNGRDVYAPQGSKFSKDYAVYGKLANGEMGYVLYVRDKQLSAHPTLEAALAALNAHYEANPRQVTEYSDVLVIDEIQSKRHQEGREKGYATKKDRDIKKKIAELTDQQDAIFDAMRAREEGRAGITNFTEEETAELKRLGEEIKQLQSELSANNGIIPDAPFDKNWHELAFKRMLRYAAENGYDYVAWTTGEQQAERYNLGKQFDSIEREDNPSINGRRFALNGANYFTFVVNEEGVITESDMSEIKGKPLADVVGKDLAIRMISLEDGDAIDFVDLRIGGEGMKGFYDRMLPSFVSKYTKKWGAKVQDINLPSLEESAQTMHAVNVTQEMKDSVMEGQVMFSVRNTAEDLRMSPESSIFAEQYDDVPYISFDEDFDTAVSDVQTSYEERFNDVVTDIEMQGAEVDESLLYQKAGVVADYIEDINKDEKYPVVVVPSNKDIYEWMTNKGVSKELARDAQNKLNEKGGDRIRGFHQNGTIFILSQNLDSLLLAKLTYAHEIQHAKNKRNANLIIKVLDAISRKEALDFISKFGNRGVYADLLNEKEEGYYTLADEVVAYAMSEGYKLGMDGNLAQYLRDKGITNEELINILNEEYERQKNDVSDSKRFFGQRDIESYRRSVAGRTQQDGGDLQARSQEMGESAELETLSRGTQGDRGRIARELAEKAQDSLLRIGAKRIARKYELATTPVEHTTMFSVTGAPTPTPTETKGEYLKRYMEWRESQIEQAARTKFVQDMKKADKFFEKAAKKLVDRNKPIDDFQKAVVAQGGKLNVGNNAYADTTMAIGRAGYQVRRFADHQLKDMLDAISEMMDSKLLDNIVLTWDNMDTEYSDPKELIKGKRLTVRELIGVYCQAMDVKEAKEKDLPDRGEAGFKKNLRDANGNEVSYEDVIRMVHDAVAGTNLTKKLWRAINNATKFALRYQLAAGMIDQETFDKYDRDYYVPERGWRERDLDGREDKYNESQGMTNGSPYNAALQKAKGRDSLASDPFAYIQSIAETSILSAEKNKVKQKFLQFVFDNEAIGRKTGAWNIRKVWLVEGANGQPEVSFEKPADESKIIKGYATESQIKLASEVRQRTRAERLQHQVIVMRDGVQYIVELESEELANTLNGKYEGMNDLWEGWGNVQRSMVNYMSAINTQYNPVFPVFNFIRDFQLAMISNIGEQDAKFTAKFMKNIGKVQGAIWKYVANEKIMGREAFLATPMGKYLEEYFEQGAQTGFSFLRDIEALNKDIDKALTEGKFKRGAKKTKDIILGTLSMMTEASELTVRLAQYVTARESGYSAEEAAQMAKEISVNFDRKGTESRALSKLYSFFNASIQGTNKIWRMVKSKKARRTLLGVSALYMALGILNTLMNPDDPEEEIWASDYTRKTNFLLGKVRIPVAHFFRIFYGAGVEIVLAAQGRKTIKQSIFDTANFTADELVPSSLFQVHNLWEYNEVMNEVEFNPAQYVQGAAPSWISPLTDVAMNRNYMGGKINKEPYTTSEEGKYKAGKYAMKNTDERWIDIADLLSGGDSSAAREYGEGKGVSGSTLQHIFEGYIGQAGKFVLDAGALPIKAAKGKEITTKDIPYVNRLIKPYKQESAYNQEYWTLKKDLQHYEFLLDKKKKEDREAYWEERSSEQYKAYMRLKRLVNRKPKEGDTHTPEDVRKLMEANKEWRKLK